MKCKISTQVMLEISKAQKSSRPRRLQASKPAHGCPLCQQFKFRRGGTFAEKTIIDGLERRIGTNPSEQSLGKSLLVYRNAIEDKCNGSWAYLSRYLYHQSFKISKICPDRSLGAVIDSFEGQVKAQTSPQALRRLFVLIPR